MLVSFKVDGCMGIILLYGVFFCSGEEGRICEGLLFGIDVVSGNQFGDFIEVVIGLFFVLFYNIGILVCVFVLNKCKFVVFKDKVIIIDVSCDYFEGKVQNSLCFEDIVYIVSMYKVVFEYQIEVENYCCVVMLDEICSNDGNFNIVWYIDNGEIEEIVDVVVILL